MRRPRARKAALSIALFPFLAVLICTMGALIVLLVLVVQQARARGPAEDDSAVQELTTRAAEAEWRREELERQRDELLQRRAAQRAELGHLEEHLERLETELKRQQAEAAEMDRLGQDRQRDVAAEQADLARLKAEIDRTKRELDDARQRAARPRSYAIIPYHGARGTRRRPIYLECTAEAVILQPEGKRFTEIDFTGPLGPGNPLSAALRATREYWAGLTNQGDPYPLLIVRPDGAMTYGLAREAMRSWDDEFGYELVEADLPLTYPPRDPALAAVLDKTVAAARERQMALAARMPSRYHGRPGTGGSSRGEIEGGLSGRGGSRYSGGGQGDGLGGTGVSRASSTGPVGTGSRAGSPSGLAGTPRERGPNGAGTEFGGLAGTGGTAGPDGALTPSMRGAGSNGSGGPAGSDGSGSGQGEDGASGAGQGQDAAPNGAAANVAMNGSPTAAATAASKAPALKRLEPLAKTRGANWGLGGKRSDSPTTITRPIRVLCLSDQIVVLPERLETGAAVTVPIRGSVRDSIDDLVGVVRKRVDSWGIAVMNGNWKPVLVFDVAPGGEGTYGDVEMLLQDSGLVVQKKS